MNFHDVNLLIEEGEGFEIEFKRRISSAEKIARTIISFANTKGGTILFGVDDNGSIVGVESEKSEIELIEIAGRDFCDPLISPTIDIVPFDGRDVIVCRIGESRTKPHYFLGEQERVNGESTRVYIRVNDNTMMASREVVKILQNENPDATPLKLSIGENEHRLFQYLEKNERITVREFGRLVNISDRRASRTLVQLVRAGVVRIHTHEKEEFFTLAYDVK
ncbi:MAG: putative DNA binding domain-containing protein [Ignavibacteriae bacterium]|nr:putative DNA binding domain-containing protein [Ignavibacteria bacterium]MBI3365622.1 putative DNA binding domain-containing protein [Ignavibacteriota bacterium]